MKRIINYLCCFGLTLSFSQGVIASSSSGKYFDAWSPVKCVVKKGTRNGPMQNTQQNSQQDTQRSDSPKTYAYFSYKSGFFGLFNAYELLGGGTKEASQKLCTSVNAKIDEARNKNLRLILIKGPSAVATVKIDDGLYKQVTANTQKIRDNTQAITDNSVYITNIFDLIRVLSERQQKMETSLSELKKKQDQMERVSSERFELLNQRFSSLELENNVTRIMDDYNMGSSTWENIEIEKAVLNLVLDDIISFIKDCTYCDAEDMELLESFSLKFEILRDDLKFVESLDDIELIWDSALQNISELDNAILE